MKLATLKEGGRDGTLIVVNKDMTLAVRVPRIAGTMQNALDDWAEKSPRLEEVYRQINNGPVEGSFTFNPAAVAAPLPRAYQWADGSSYVVHVELVRKARGAELPENFWTDPLMYQGGSDNFIGPCDAIEVESEDYGIDFESEIAVITDDVPMGITPEDAASHIKLLMILNDVSLRNLIPDELAKGFGFFQSKPATAFSPVAITPDELREFWDGARVNLPLITTLNGKRFGNPNAGKDMIFSFPQLVAHAAKTRHLCAGTIVGSGTVSNQDRTVGSSCLAEKRMIEKIETGEFTTPFMKYDDRVQIEMLDVNGHSLFGKISQTVIPYKYDNKARNNREAI
jgi:fumarylacetoacetate (FAA) hydrolase